MLVAQDIEGANVLTIVGNEALITRVQSLQRLHCVCHHPGSSI